MWCDAGSGDNRFYGIATWGVAGCSRRAAACSVAAALLAFLARAVSRRAAGTVQKPEDSSPPRRARVVDGQASVAACHDVPLAATGAFSPAAAAISVEPRRIALAIAFVSVFSLLGAEVIWTRLLTFVFGHDTYAFATLLCVVSMGHALGGLLYAALARYSPSRVVTAMLSLTSATLLGCFYAASSLVIRGGRDPFALGDRLLGTGALSLEIMREWAFTPVLAFVPCFFSGVAYCASSRVSLPSM